MPKADVGAPSSPSDAPSRSWELYSPRQRRRFLFILFLVGVCNYADRNVVSVLLEQIKAEFNASDTQLGLMSGLSFALFYALLGIPIARWADRGDRTFVVTASIGVWSLMMAFCGLPQAFWQLLLARFGVGTGEAGAIPAAQSLIADYYPPDRRAQAIGIFTVASVIGNSAALIAGGYVAQHHGWRAAFFLLGLSGVVLLPLTALLLSEPRRRLGYVERGTGESAWAAIRSLLHKPSYKAILCAIILYFLVAYGAVVFMVSFMIRRHGLEVAQAGTIFGLISAAGALVGSIGGGYLVDRLAGTDLRWLPRLAGVGVIAAAVAYEAALSAGSFAMLMAMLLVATILVSATVPSMYSALHVVCGSSRRSLAVAFAFFAANLIGLGLGPVLAGAVSDALRPAYGAADALRFAMMLVTLALIPCGIFMLRAAKSLAQDAEE